MLAIDSIFLAIVAFMCLLLSFSLFFLAAIPAFLIFGALFLLAAVASAANIVTGTGTIITSVKGGKISKVFSAVSLAVDAVVMPAQIFLFAYSVYCFIIDPAPILTVMALFSFIAVCLCIAGVALNVIKLVSDGKSQVAA